MSRRTDDETTKAILLMAGKGASNATIAKACGVSDETVRRIRNAARKPAALPPVAAPAEAPAPDAAVAPPAVPSSCAPPPAAPTVPEGLTGYEADLWILDNEIEATRLQLADARQKSREGGSTHGLAALGSLLASLLDRRAKIRPPPPPDEDADEKRWRADADAVLRQIEAGVRAAEGRAA